MHRSHLTAEQIEVCKRFAEIRKSVGISERLAATQSGLTREQLRRIERGEAAIGFSAAWNFCQQTDVSPLWLAFGDIEAKEGFVSCANSTVPSDALFLDVMLAYGDRYRTYRVLTHEAWFNAASVFSDDESILTAEFIRIAAPKISERSPEEKKLAAAEIKLYLTRATMPEPKNWEDLQVILCSQTQSRPKKLELARHLGVTLAAISQWRSGATAPTADNALKILAWVRGSRAKATHKEKNSARTSAEARAPKTQKGKSKTNEKSKSDHKQQG